MSLRIEEILLGVPIDAKHRITTIVEMYRDRIRDAVKDAVLLSLGGRGRPRHSIAIDIRDGAPKIVSEVLLHDDLGAALTAHRGAFAASAECMTLLAGIPIQLDDEMRLVYLGQCPSSAAEEVERFLREMVARIDRANILQRILEIDQDYLGVYEPGQRSGTIGVYWGLIVDCALRFAAWCSDGSPRTEGACA